MHNAFDVLRVGAGSRAGKRAAQAVPEQHNARVLADALNHSQRLVDINLDILSFA